MAILIATAILTTWLDEKMNQSEIDKLNTMPDETRRQHKLDYIIALLEGEGANSAAGIIVTVIASFAVTVATQHGMDPMANLANISREARAETKRMLKDGGILTSRPNTN